MRTLLIVDDEAVVRALLRTLVDWQNEGFDRVEDAASGTAALKILQSQPVDVLITDIKMPGMDGLELLEHARALKHPPLTLVLSGYTDYPLVRQAFRLGAYDYIGKADISRESLKQYAAALRAALTDGPWKADQRAQEPGPAHRLRDWVLRPDPSQGWLLPQTQPYCIALFQMEDARRELVRFQGDLQETLVSPLLGFAYRVPRVAQHGILTDLTPTRYLLLIHAAQDGAIDVNAPSVCAQVKSIWKKYMNLSFSCGVSAWASGKDSLDGLIRQADDTLSLSVLFGGGQVLAEDARQRYNPMRSLDAGKQYSALLQALLDADQAALAFFCRELSQRLSLASMEEARQVCLDLLYTVAVTFSGNGDDDPLYGGGPLWDKIYGFDNTNSLLMWTANILEKAAVRLAKKYPRQPADPMARARTFILRNFTNPALSLTDVAEYVGFNEKYFSTRFKQMFGVSFREYLGDLRIQQVLELLHRSDLHIYEISAMAGYQSVEHCMRMFKKKTGLSPAVYKSRLSGAEDKTDQKS